MRGLWLALLLLPVPARAGVSASGYLKTLYSYSRSPLSGGDYWSDLSRARLTLDAARAAPP
ncbi:MAG: hypothetical protein KGL53_13085, partial [Elusimicrobia bacterium]|nr:hypothetical protein [Elusimicrobiota bacterium]